MAEMHLTTRCYRNRPPDTARDFLLAISCRPKARHYNWKPSMSPIDPLKNLRSGCPALQIGRLLVYSFLLFFFFAFFLFCAKQLDLTNKNGQSLFPMYNWSSLWGRGPKQGVICRRILPIVPYFNGVVTFL